MRVARKRNFLQKRLAQGVKAVLVSLHALHFAASYEGVSIMADFQILSSNFNATTITVVALSQRAKERLGCGVSAVSAEIRKSALPAFVCQMEVEGFVVA